VNAAAAFVFDFIRCCEVKVVDEYCCCCGKKGLGERADFTTFAALLSLEGADGG
jgi:hypothetical protein